MATIKQIQENGEDIYPKTSADAIEGLKEMILGMMYPVGSIYMTTQDINPETVIGGTWEKYAEGRTIIGANATYPAGSTGGEATHKLSTAEMPSHGHGFSGSGNTSGTSWNRSGTAHIKGAITENSNPRADGFASVDTSWNSGDQVGQTIWQSKGVYMDVQHNHSISVSGTVASTGSSQAHNNMQPYIATYIWKRIE